MKNTSIIISILTLGCVALAYGQNPRPFGKSHLAGNPNAEVTPVPAKTAAANTATKSGGKLSAQDKAFINNAAKGGMMEVEMGKVAAQNAQNAEVKKFGNRMVADHSKANSELMTLAKEEGVSLPAAKSAGKWKSDKDYMDMMVKDHEKDLAEFQKEAQSGTDADLKKFADKTAKVVSNHLQMAKEIQGKLK
ncbi:MAG: putative rane protein [Verrucomicrobiota bacterium]|jgi:putative membrane protein